MGGLIIGHEVARALGTRFLFTERDASGRMTLRRGFAVQPGEVAVVVEDVVTTGGSTREVIDILKAAGARPIAAGSIIDRSGGKAEVGAPRVALATLEVLAYRPEDCPLCRQGEAGHQARLPGSRSGVRQNNRVRSSVRCGAGARAGKPALERAFFAGTGVPTSGS